MRTTVLVAAAAILLAGAGSSAPASASRFAFVYTDHMNVTLCDNGCGITLADYGFGLVVNTSATDINAGELFGAHFTATSSNPDFRLTPFVNNPGPPVAPIHPGEAVGSVLPPVGMLPTLLLPGEVLRNTAPLQLIAFQVDRLGPSNGLVRFDVHLTMGGEQADFPIFATMSSGPHAITFQSASRVASVPIPVAATPTSWGRLKTLYR